MNRAVFLDRDGVIIENRDDYVRSWEDVSIYPQALQALARLSALPYKIVIVTNQSAVGRGIITMDTANELNHKLVAEIEKAGGRVDGVYICPHTPSDDCSCRKPRAGLILQAAEFLQIDLKNSFMVGDALSDLQAGQAAGVGQVILVRTGRGAQQALLPEAAQIGPFPVCNSLVEVVDGFLLVQRE